MIISGIPKPRLKEERAMMPLAILPLSPITISVATNGGATQAVTINADKAPMIITPI